MNTLQARAFFAGVQSAEKPLKFAAALKQLQEDDAEAMELGEATLKGLWDKCEANLAKERKDMLKIPKSDLLQEVTQLSSIGDYFLTGLTVSGTDFEEMESDEASDLLTEMEDHLLLLDEWIAEGEEGTPSAEWKTDGEKYRTEFLEIWKELEEAF